MALIRDVEQLSTDINTARAGFFGEYKFGYLGEVNQSHNTTYPLMILLPPSSSFNEIYKNDETVRCQFYCYRRVMTDVSPTNASVMLERTFDDLLERFTGTMQALSLDFEHRYVLTGGWSIERVSSEHNDDLIGLIIDISINKFSQCLLYGTGV